MRQPAHCARFQARAERKTEVRKIKAKPNTPAGRNARAAKAACGDVMAYATLVLSWRLYRVELRR
jgi:hypothetical protein